ncbi:MAG TPA: site-specific integrase [Urbifossiella sp.]|nr:site-specific integrase [Urbifossiella sp.]
MRNDSEKPWFRKVKNAWYCWQEGRQVSLGVQGRENEKAALKAFYRKMAEEPKPKAVKPQAASVRELCDAFLSDAEGRVKANTYASYGGLLNGFKALYGDKEAESMTAAAVYSFANKPHYSSSHRHNLIASISTAFKWAAAKGILRNNPLKELKRPPKASRGAKAAISADGHAKLLKAASKPLRTLLLLLWETGARPSELARLEAKNIDFSNRIAELREHKTAEKTGKPRLLVLTEKAAAILQELAEQYPEGSLLRNASGKPWKKDGIGLAMRRASKSAGVKAIAYGYRHAYATQALANGVPDATVAALLGHSSTAMLHKHYSHLGSRADVLREAASKVR